MNSDQIRQRKAEIVAQFGAWEEHNIYLQDDLYTIDSAITSREKRLRRILQIIADVSQKPFKGLRIVDLACLEGLYAIEFARQGSQSIGIEGRKASVERAKFVKEALGLDNLEIYQDDVRNLSAENYGSFDVVVCLGILYHLDAPDVFQFVKNMHDVCRGFTIIDTEISLSDSQSVVFEGKSYRGKYYKEHNEGDSADVKEKRTKASLDNLKSFWLTRSSLYNLLADVGFTSVYECANPAVPGRREDRIMIVAIKGQMQSLISSPTLNEQSLEQWPEHLPTNRHPNNTWQSDVSKLLPRPLKNLLKRFLRSVRKTN